MKRPIHKPHVTQRLLRASGVRNRMFPPAKLAKWAAHPRPPYCGQPSQLILKKVDVVRDDLNGRPVYQVSPRYVDARELNGHLLYLHGGAYVLDLLPHFHWPAIARLANMLHRTITVPIYPVAPEHNYRQVFPLSVLGTPVKVDPLGCFIVGSHFRIRVVGGGPQVGVEVERPQRSEDERPRCRRGCAAYWVGAE